MFIIILLLSQSYAEMSLQELLNMEVVAKETVQVGVLIPLSGGLAGYGGSMEDALKVAENEINDNGGILGKDIEFIYKDTGTDPDQGKLAAQELVDEGALIRDALREIAYGGTVVRTFAAGITAINAGTDINYDGVSGKLDFDVNGNVTAPYQLWKVVGNVFEFQEVLQ
ncbi:ABC transporter substrate-binding protein [candidate division WOR-3 bacterium]|nr:ABC transporter substrate-binding protein [candidate division WOR-3 bacterium]